MKKSVIELRSIVAMGGSIVINAGDYSVLELRSIAASTTTDGGKMVILNAIKLNYMECRAIISAGIRGCVILNFTD